MPARCLIRPKTACVKRARRRWAVWTIRHHVNRTTAWWAADAEWRRVAARASPSASPYLLSRLPNNSIVASCPDVLGSTKVLPTTASCCAARGIVLRHRCVPGIGGVGPVFDAGGQTLCHPHRQRRYGSRCVGMGKMTIHGGGWNVFRSTREAFRKLIGSLLFLMFVASLRLPIFAPCRLDSAYRIWLRVCADACGTGSVAAACFLCAGE